MSGPQTAGQPDEAATPRRGSTCSCGFHSEGEHGYDENCPEHGVRRTAPRSRATFLYSDVQDACGEVERLAEGHNHKQFLLAVADELKKQAEKDPE